MLIMCIYNMISLLLLFVFNELFTIFPKVDCEYSDWGEWAECNAACGGGTQSRTREPVRLAWYGRVKCTAEDATEGRPCNENACPGAINICHAIKMPY